MKILLALILTLLSLNTLAECQLLHNPSRDGEGISACTRDNTLAFLFFTYYDNSMAVPPIVSPPPPDPVQYECRNESVWYLGAAQNWDGEIATGDLYLARGLDYPNVDIAVNKLQDMVNIGTFLITDNGDGYDLQVNSNNYFPSSMYLFTHTFNFSTVIIE